MFFSLGLYGLESMQGLRLDGHLGSMRDGAGLPAPSFSRLWCRTKSQNNPESVLRIVGNDRSSEKNHREINLFERSSDRQNDVDGRASPDCCPAILAFCLSCLSLCLSLRYLQIRYSNKTMSGGEKLPFPRPKLGRPAGVNIFFEILPQCQIMIE